MNVLVCIYVCCSYADVFPPPLDDAASSLSTPCPSVNQRVVQFSAFAIHLLTGWNPTAPVDAHHTFLFEPSRSKMLLKAMLSDGVCEVHENDIVRDRDEQNSLDRYKSFRITRTDMIPEGSIYANDDSDEDDEDEESVEPVSRDPMQSIKEGSVGSLSSDEHLLSPGHDYLPSGGEDGVVLRTKRQFKFEYKKRKNYRDKVIDSILTRERKIAKTSTALAAEQSSINFIGFVDSDTTQGIRLLPVLGVSYPIYRRDNLLMVLLLVRWRVGEPQETPFSPNPNPDDPFYGKIRGVDEGPLPLTTPLHYEWISVDQLVKKGAFLISMDTNMYTNTETDFAARWVSTTPAVVPPPVTEKAAKEKAPKGGKAASKEALVAEVPVADTEFYAEPGSIPITLFKLNVNEFFVPAGEQRTSNRKSSIRVTQTLDKSIVEMDELLVNPFVPRHKYLHFTLAVHLDAVVEYKEGSKSMSGGGNKQSPIPGNTVVVLQEFRTDNAEPLCFLMELKSDSYLPIVSKTFGISQKQLLQRDPMKPIVFWMRLFSSASVFIKFYSEVSMTVGPAETIWSQMGKKIFVRDGVCPDVPEQTQQLIFRLPLVAVTSSSSGPADTSVPAVTAPTHVAAVFLHVKEHVIESIISTGCVPSVADSDSFFPFARNQGNIVQLSEDPAGAPILIGRAFPSRDLKAGIPSFKWKLLILSEMQVKEPAKSSINEEKVSQKYSGKYVANNENLLFRDVYTFERSSFPIAFRLLSKKNRSVEARGAQQQQTAMMKHLTQNKKIQAALKNALKLPRATEVSLIVRAYRLPDNKLVGEYKGGETVLCYFQDLKSCLPDGEGEPSLGSAAAAAPVKKDAKAPAGKGPAKGAIAVPETVDVLIECLLDESRMQLPMHWQSRFPHVFDDLMPSCEESKGTVSNSLNSIEAQSKYLNVKPPVDVLMSWKMEVLAGRVTNVSHDTRRLVGQAAVKNSWEASGGRAERAVAALAFYQEYSARRAGAAQASTDEGAGASSQRDAALDERKQSEELTPSMISNLVVALQSEEELMKRRYEQQYTHLPKVRTVGG